MLSEKFWAVFLEEVHERAKILGMVIAVAVRDFLAYLPELV